MSAVFLATVLLGAFSMFILLKEARAVDQVKSTEILIVSSASVVTDDVNALFSLYIGDNISSVTEPVKSLNFAISGVYTGGGTLTLSLDSDSVTSRTFTLPNVSSPTAFDILYRDPSAKISPISAGAYSYTLNIVPDGISIYGLSAIAKETHRYAPSACSDGASTNQKVKTNEFFIVSSEGAVDNVMTDSFTLYIGDDISGITNSVKSLYFVAQGNYTGGGSLTFSLDSDSATSRTFTLPNVSSPTSFSLMYRDAAESINPTSGGSYTHTITTAPSGVTLYDFSIKLVETHRYRPPTCGGMPVKGELYSAVFESTGTTTGPTYNSLLWKGALGGPSVNQGKVRFQLAASECPNGATNYPACSTGTWLFVGGETCSATDWFDSAGPDMPYDLQASSCIDQWNNKRYFRYGIQICSDDCSSAGSYTPRVDDVVVNYSP